MFSSFVYKKKVTVVYFFLSDNIRVTVYTNIGSNIILVTLLQSFSLELILLFDTVSADAGSKGLGQRQ